MDGNVTSRILCPWCGVEMRVCTDENSVFDYNGWTECTNNKCTAEGPLVTGRETEEEAIEAARAAALRRFTPTLKPMTWDEFVRMTHPRLDGTEYPPVYVETAKTYSGRHGSWIIAKPNAIRVDARYKPLRAFVDAHCVNLDAMAYGKTWRCWERKPTEEERSAAEWITD